MTNNGLDQATKNSTTWDVLNAAHAMLRTVVRGVDADGWTRPTPCDQWTVTQVLQHAAGDQLAFAAAITGGPGPAENPFAPSGTLDADPLVFLDTSLVAAADAWAGIDAAAESAATPLPQGALAPRIGAGACALDAAVHAWDIAVATGQPSPLSPLVASELLFVAREIVEPLRRYGAYAPVVDGSDGAEIGELLRYLGRRPDWKA
ncbi:TIGR03086 family metal-binding protein [Rhodococcus jostii]|uniref:TIGR03086 family metal-binding protein n=1 Tax=Rhodococcus jostii TaxID=132919 RepID=UPI0036411D5C